VFCCVWLGYTYRYSGLVVLHKYVLKRPTRFPIFSASAITGIFIERRRKSVCALINHARIHRLAGALGLLGLAIALRPQS